MLLFPTKPHMPICLQDPEEPERQVQQRFSQKQSTGPNSKDGEPCNECEMCRSITAGTQEDATKSMLPAIMESKKSDLSAIGQIMRLQRQRTKCTLLMRYICFQQELSMPC